MDILQNQSLLHYNTFGIQTTAEYFCKASTVEDIKEGIAYSQNKQLLVLGGGSNILFTKDVAGLCLQVNVKGIEKIGQDNEYYYIKAWAGENWHQFVMHCICNNWGGVENLSLIPGCVGASPMQNIGAYGVELKDVFYCLEAIHRKDLSIRKFTKDECDFGYRTSIFKTGVKEEYIILNVTFKLPIQPLLNVSYGAIEQELDRLGANRDSLTIKDISDAVIAIRSSKLPDPKFIGNAGSFFKNPSVTEKLFLDIKERFPDVVAYPQDNGTFKLAAGWLIEKAGWKGKRINNHGVHDKQALVLVNYGGAKGSDIYHLSEDILNDVKHKFGVELEREVNII